MESLDLVQGQKDEKHCLHAVAKMSNLGNESNLALASCAEQRESVLELKLRSRISALVKF